MTRKADPILLGRWYRRPHAHGVEVRCPYKFKTYEDSGRPGVVYRSRRHSSGCSVYTWRNWAKKAELMPDDWEPEDHDGWEPPGKTPQEKSEKASRATFAPEVDEATRSARKWARRYARAHGRQSLRNRAKLFQRALNSEREHKIKAALDFLNRRS